MEMEEGGRGWKWRKKVRVQQTVEGLRFLLLLFLFLFTLCFSNFEIPLKKKKKALPGISFMPRSQPACVFPNAFARVALTQRGQEPALVSITSD